MTDSARPAGPGAPQPAGGVFGGPQAWFELLAAGEGRPATVRAGGDIDLTNAGQFEAALAEAAAAGGPVTADMSAVTSCDSAAIRSLFNAAKQVRLTIQVSAEGSVTEALLEVSGLDQVATVVTLG